MTSPTSSERNASGEWRPEQPIKLAPINDWPLKPVKLAKWAFGWPGFMWPYNALWLAVTVATWLWLTPSLAAMQTIETWWVGLIFARNLAIMSVIFGGLHVYFYVVKGQGETYRFTLKPFIKGARHFLFRDQVRDNMLRTLAVAVPVITAYEVATYWLFANGFLGLFSVGDSPYVFWGWFVVMILAAPFIHSVHFYLGHRLLHVKWWYKHFHALHHRNVEVGPWSGLAMHPVEHLIYFSAIVVPWLLALHPLNALYQLHLAAFLPALSHSGYDKLKVGSKLEIDAGAHFHYLHHKYFECNYGGSLLPLDKMLGTFHDGTAVGHASLRQRIRERRKAMV
jgi:sterol desaturase/sphingolipid hydroxylase (fatty acid hydroxylase superfamily)